MEFERALFRIHQKALLTGPLRRLRLQLERVLPLFIAVQIVVLVALHRAYVGQSNCLPQVLQHAGLWNDTLSQPVLADDAVLFLSLSSGDGITDLTFVEKTPNSSVVFSESNSLALYRFALDRELAQLRKGVFQRHNFEVHNVSLSVNCLAPYGPLAQALQVFDAWDGLVINELAYGFHSRGFLERLQNDETLEAWAWTEDQVESQGHSLVLSLLRKAMLLLSASLSFGLISAVTGLFIRIAVHGSAVLMFPMALAAQYLGMSTSRMSLHILSRSFPWIGVHVDVLRAGNRPLWPLFRSHLVFLLIQSFAYLSCNLAWRFLLYRKSAPEGFEENIFSLCSVIELFNLIFVRSVPTAALYPKVVAAAVVYLHFYILSSLYPFHGLMLMLCTSVCVYTMVYCLNHFEEPALAADPFSHSTPTSAHPRALFLPLLSPSWTLEAAPLWTMFYSAEPGSAFPEDAMRHIQSEEYNMP
mmetsp:Transcript_47305/g.112424  ORF Transcript_47305/g.112424 Transcript_47305/m.112424 type:complete len:472 (+) Transcript_47305:100-1515(+)